MRFDVLTLFPDMFEAITRHGVSGRAYAAGIWQLHCWNPRDFTTRKMGYIDDRPFGGGPGMVMQAQPLSACVAQIDKQVKKRQHRILLSPAAKPIKQADIRRLIDHEGLTLVAGRYEGIDQRFIDRDIDEAFALGDLVVSGGELPAMMLIDAILRWVPGVLHDAQSAQQDSFVDGLLDCPHYTRPETWEAMQVPEVLLGGDHEAIAVWRRREALRATARLRPDLLRQARTGGLLSADDERFMAKAAIQP
ncbi:MAG: tRNA (guanosine(37)-N1)-methyltransferase TrmD [Betaproteobacteria bacterium]|nr:tRNA (guanosine(37)-N1)-methyltransferase TrmD [Pseudomonadota bacterium]NBO04842.1 tRNA (guanosine(37)-N1)-methyltransferase TrmD [Betaproteobacteria bacterium]HAB48093.1 tRNA (guanosine(37)-N1)-methyltransferase TrmD [Lautropia sp.]NBO96401.1 tRNA (guanosine(37)-N1)-methyltransferase TrmD [Betaproteobacteria bacterium]NBP35011.1 tRNA (guanosine(37)-N1)-methyltransferase TrmD [Betaproteobacteria bacterium]